MIIGLGVDTARRLGLLITVPAGTGCVLVCSGDGRIDADVPHDFAGRVGERLHSGEHLRPHPGALPAPEQAVDRLPRSVPVRNVPLRASCADAPPDPVDELAFRPLRRPTRLLSPRQQRLQPCPLRVGQIRPPRYRYAGHEVSGIQVCLGRLTLYRRPRSFSCHDTPGGAVNSSADPHLKHGLVVLC